MAFLKTFFWMIVAVIVVLLFIQTPRVDVPIWGDDTDGLILNGRLGAFLIVAFLIGFVPLYFYYHTVKWRLKRRVKALETQVAAHNRTIAAQSEAAAAKARESEVEAPSASNTLAAAKAEILPTPRPAGEGDKA